MKINMSQEEYKKISQEEYKKLLEWSEEYRWVARSKVSQVIYLYKEKPVKVNNVWTGGYEKREQIPRTCFLFLKHTDSEPLCIEDTLSNYGIYIPIRESSKKPVEKNKALIEKDRVKRESYVITDIEMIGEYLSYYNDKSNRPVNVVISYSYPTHSNLSIEGDVHADWDELKDMTFEEINEHVKDTVLDTIDEINYK